MHSSTPAIQRIQLESIEVPEPCTVPWTDMQGNHQVRHCRQCDKQVFNLSAMSRDEAERLLAERAGNLCVNFCRRSDGTVVTRDFRARPELAGKVQRIASRLLLPSLMAASLAACQHVGGPPSADLPIAGGVAPAIEGRPGNAAGSQPLKQPGTSQSDASLHLGGAVKPISAQELGAVGVGRPPV